MNGINGLENREIKIDGYIPTCISTCEKGIYSNIFCHKTAENILKVKEEEFLAPQIKSIGGMN
jgi:hypothetical protein